MLFNENDTKGSTSLPLLALSPAAGLHVTSKRARKSTAFPKEVKTGEVYSDGESLNFSFDSSASVVSRVMSSGTKIGGRRTSVNSPVYSTTRPKDSFDLNLSGTSDLFSSTYRTDAFQSLNSSFNFEPENTKNEKPQDKKSGVKKHLSRGNSLLNNSDLLSRHVGSFESLDTLDDTDFHQKLENSQASKYTTPTFTTTRATTPVSFTLSTLSAKTKVEGESVKPPSTTTANPGLVVVTPTDPLASPPVTIISSRASLGANTSGKKHSRSATVPNDAKIAQILDALTESGTYEQGPIRNLGDETTTDKASGTSSQLLFSTTEGESSMISFASPLLIRSKKVDKKSNLRKMPPNSKKEDSEETISHYNDPPPLEDSDSLTGKDVCGAVEQKHEHDEHFSLPLAFHPALKSTAFQCFSSPLAHLNCTCFAPHMTALLHQPFNSREEKKDEKDEKRSQVNTFGLPIRPDGFSARSDISTFEHPDLRALDIFQANLLRTTISVEPTMQSVTFLHNELRQEYQQNLLKSQNGKSITLDTNGKKNSTGSLSEMDAIFQDNGISTTFYSSNGEESTSVASPTGSVDSSESNNEENIWDQICEEYKDRSMVFKYAQLHNYRQRMRIRQSIQLGHGGMIENYGERSSSREQNQGENVHFLGSNAEKLEKQREEVTQNSLRFLRLKKQEAMKTTADIAKNVRENVRGVTIASEPSLTTKRRYENSNDEIFINDSLSDDSEIELVESERLTSVNRVKRQKVTSKSFVELPGNESSVPKIASIATIDVDRNYEGIQDIREDNLYHFNDMVLVFPSAFLHVHSTGKVGYLRFLNTTRPVLEIEFGESMLLFRGNYVNTQNLYTLKPAQASRPFFDAAENVRFIESTREGEKAVLFDREMHKLTAPSMFVTDTLLVFSEYKWVEGGRVRNLTDVKIEFQEQANDVSIIPQVHTRSFESYISKVETMQ